MVDVDLEGDISIFEPVTVFQLINFAQRTGGLYLDTGTNSAQVYFDRGNITYAEIDQRAIKLGERLVERGLITRIALKSALARSRRERTRLGTELLTSGLIDESELRLALEDQVKEVIYEVVRWRTGTFQFFTDKTPFEQDVSIDISLDHLMLEGFKRMDEEAGQR